MNVRSWSPKVKVERSFATVALVLVLLGPVIFSPYWAHTLLTETFFYGIAAASLIFLFAYGGMISLAQTALFAIAGFILGNLVTHGGPGGTSKGLHLGWDPTLAIIVAILGTTLIGLIMGAVAARSTGIYFLMITLTFSVIATYTLGQVTKISGFSGIGGISGYTPGWIGDIQAHPDRLYYVALGTAVVVYVLIRYIVRTPFGIALQGVRDEPLRMTSLGYNVPLHRTLAFGFAAFIASLGGILYVWWSGQIAPGNVDLPETINLLVMAVIGGLLRIEGAWLGAFAFIVIQNYVRDFHVPGLSFGGTLFGGTFNTVVGVIFLVIVLVSPGGLMGIWDRAFAQFGRGRAGPRTPDEVITSPGT
jgi:branched-chain amino acid transport system permease protein